MISNSDRDDLIAGFATGRLPKSIWFLAANYVELNPDCKHMAMFLESVGGAMLEELPTSSINHCLFERVMEAVDKDNRELEPKVYDHQDSDLPQLLKNRVGSAIDQLPWREIAGVSEFEITPTDQDGYRTCLVRVRAGKAVPQHTHLGDELTLVLRGGFSDQTGHYQRGDLAIANHSVDHKPVADCDMDCLCLTVQNAPISFTGPISRFLNPFINFSSG